MVLKKRYIIALVIAACIVLMVICKPADKGKPYNDYFAALNRELKTNGIALPCIIIDLDRVDHNIHQMNSILKAPLHYRIVTKSLPSIELVDYVMKKTNTNKLMEFHQPYLSLIIKKFGYNLDILLGKPFPIQSVQEFYNDFPKSEYSKLTDSVQWLIDNKQRLSEYLSFARNNSLKLKVNIEIDVGLHRGGLKTVEELNELLSIIQKNKDNLEFTGFMGYDGHLLHIPVFIGSKEKAVRKEFEQIMKRYKKFVDYANNTYPELFKKKLTFNSGGSSTYVLYNSSYVVNDIAAGSCVVKPSTFDFFTLKKHLPAIFIAAPILKKINSYEVPFLERFKWLIEWWDPNCRQTYYTYGGGWNEVVEAPEGVVVNALTASPPNENLLPNQSMLNGSLSTKLEVGDFVFYRPKQGDAIFQFRDIIVIRNGKIIASWKPFPERF